MAEEIRDSGLIAEPIGPVPVEVSLTSAGGAPPPPFSRFFLNLGFVGGLVLASVCLAIASWYLISYLRFGTGTLVATAGSSGPDPQALMANMYMARVLLQSCGLAVGMAFGFLGFSLFLLGVGGSMDANASASGGLGIQVARISPGAFVMLCSAILVGLCATKNVQATMRGSGQAAEIAEDSSRFNAIAADEPDSADGADEPVRDLPRDSAANAGDPARTSGE